MSSDVVSVHSDATIQEALVALVERKVSALPVVDGERRCMGMLSATDLVGMTRTMIDELTDPSRISLVLQEWLANGVGAGSGGRQNVEDLMTNDVLSVTRETPLLDAATLMLEHHVHRLPVLDDERHLIGIISTMDILAAFVEGA